RSPPIKERARGKRLAAGPWAWQARHVSTLERWWDTSAFVFSIGQAWLFTGPHGGVLAVWELERNDSDEPGEIFELAQRCKGINSWRGADDCLLCYTAGGSAVGG